jgi:hypothetical protein
VTLFDKGNLSIYDYLMWKVKGDAARHRRPHAQTLQEPIKDPARFPWHEVTKVQHYWLEIDAMTRPRLPQPW